MKNFKNAVYVISFIFCFGIVGSLDCDRISFSQAAAYITAACAVSFAVFIAEKLVRLTKVLLYRLAKRIIKYRRRRNISQKEYAGTPGLCVKA